MDQVIDGYLWNKESVEFKIDENANLITDSEYGILFETTFENQKVKGSIEIQKFGEELEKTDEEYIYHKVPLEGVVIGLYQNGELIGEYTTDENGYIKINNLQLGKYILKEISTVDNHILEEKEYEIELKYKDQYTAIVNYKITLNNYLPKGKLEFTKTNPSSEPIPNTLIEIYNENDELLFSKRTDDKGMIVMDALPLGKYYILEKETATPDYILNTEKIYFEIKENSEVVKCTMTNELIVEVPNTNKSSYKEIIISSSLILLSLGLILYGTKKKK